MQTMGWLLLVCLIPAVPLLLIEFAVPAVRRALARKASAPQGSAEGPYRESPVPTEPRVERPPPAYAAAWARYRRNRLVALILFLTFFPAMFFVSGIGWWLTGTQVGMLVFILGWLVSAFLYYARMYLFRCPRCRDSFRSLFGWTTTFASKCHACGLRIFALTPDDDHEPARH